MDTTKLHDLYWETQKLHDKLHAMEQYMRKLTEQGKSCIKTQAKYFYLLDQLRKNHAEMVLIESNIEAFSA